MPSGNCENRSTLWYLYHDHYLTYFVLSFGRVELFSVLCFIYYNFMLLVFCSKKTSLLYLFSLICYYFEPFGKASCHISTLSHHRPLTLPHVTSPLPHFFSHILYYFIQRSTSLHPFHITYSTPSHPHLRG